VGGLVNAVVAPLVFTQVAEYPLMLAVAAALRPAPAWRGGRDEPAALVFGVPLMVFTVLMATWSAGLASGASLGANVTGFWLAAAAALAAVNRRAAFAAAVSLAVLAHLTLPRRDDGSVLYAARSFFGVHRVLESQDRTMHRLTHGTTLHGWQRLGTGRCEPTSYYHPDGPIGQLFRAGRTGTRDVAVIGLGAGGLACYAPAGSRWTFLEIDPLVERIARDPALFTFLALSPGAPRVVIGDGRIRLRELAAGTLDTLVIDAFSSDAVPVHLLTREFVALALERVRPDGRVVFHISNRYLDLGPVLAAAAASLGAEAFEQAHAASHPDAVPSRWLVVGRPATLADLAADARWWAPTADGRMWTDDFSNILDVIAWDPRQAMPVR
jgi:SAM-dependent methyltransferase